jgi:predicted ATPase/DNA-binding winged helix-turn-helix (wHTH) protein
MNEALRIVARDAISFGPFRLLPAQRLLEKAGEPTRLAGRALDILLVLTECAGEVVGKQELVARVWPGLTVEDGSLRFHVAVLRRVLGDGIDGARYITNIPGRGYCFVAPVQRAHMPALLASRGSERAPRTLPPRLIRMVGRQESVRAIAAQLAQRRFVTIVGPGGIGKTTVAVAAADAMLAEFGNEVHFVDFAPVRGASLVAGAVASIFGLPVQSDNPVPNIINFVRQRRMLIVFDNCEHVIGAAASLAEQIFREAPGIHILATSREVLRVEGETVHALPPLESPPEQRPVTAAEALCYAAVQLFVERAAASSDNFVLSNDNAGTIAEICRRLDGIALAIELAAGRVNAYGVAGVASLLDDRFRVLTQGRRTALSRHQTLRATLDWSYDLLSPLEQTILRRLAVFAGIFTPQSARAVAADDADAATHIFDAMANLVAKSLIATEVSDGHVQYRLLDSTRAYAHGKLLESGDADRCAWLHARYYADFLEQAETQVGAPAEGLAHHAAHIGNVRAALEWAFSPHGDTAIAVALAASAAPLLLELSLLSDCHEWTSLAVASLAAASAGSRLEMVLQASLGVALVFTKGNGEEAHAALSRGLDLAERLGDTHYAMRLLDTLYVFRVRLAEFPAALAIAQRADTVARRTEPAGGTQSADWMLAISYHFDGQTGSARSSCENALLEVTAGRRVNIRRFGVDHRIHALCALGRGLWLQGYPDQALRTGRLTIEEAETLDHPVSLCIALVWVIPVALWCGEFAMAETLISRLTAYAENHSLAPTHAQAIGWRGCLHVVRGEPEQGIKVIQQALATLQLFSHQLLKTVLLGYLAEAFAKNRDHAASAAAMEEVLQRIERTGEYLYLPEMLRIRGEIVAADASCDPSAAEGHFLRSLHCAHEQSALSWELRTAMSLATLRHRQGRAAEGQAELARVYGRFTEGFGTADLTAARCLLDGMAGGEIRRRPVTSRQTT